MKSQTTFLNVPTYTPCCYREWIRHINTYRGKGGKPAAIAKFVARAWLAHPSIGFIGRAIQQVGWQPLFNILWENQRRSDLQDPVAWALAVVKAENLGNARRG